ncbi:MAG: hypothetical protein NXI31_20610 [bacterium]|nr:hypothetical protein [bacterium]
MCRALVQRILGAEPVKTRIGKLAVGLAANCDAGEPAVEQLMLANLPNASSLPFVAVLTHEGEWLAGYSGGRATKDFVAMLDRVEKLGKLDASPAVQKQLNVLADAAEKSVSAGKWSAVLKAARVAGKSFGRCEGRTRIRAAMQRARDWAQGQFEGVVERTRSGGHTAPEIKRLKAVSRAFRGEAEATEAAAGVKALSQLNRVRAVEARGSAAKDLRARFAKELGGTRWAKLFVEATTADK